jgi:type III pantothenate kinase
MEDKNIDTSAVQPQLVLVIGNTTATMAVFTGAPDPVIERISSRAFADPAVMRESLETLVGRFGAFRDTAICSVVPDIASRSAELLESMMPVPPVIIGAGLKLPFHLEYENHHAFGADRIALCAWSQGLFSRQAHIAVDIGTAITFDVLDSKGRYVGGLILPGLDMMAGALHSRTAQLPLVRVDRSSALLGRSTEECIRSGIFWGAVKEIGGLIDEIGRYLQNEQGESSVSVIATGGNSRLIAQELDNIQVVDELAVARGSRLLLDFNRA